MTAPDILSPFASAVLLKVPTLVTPVPSPVQVPHDGKLLATIKQLVFEPIASLAKELTPFEYKMSPDA